MDTGYQKRHGSKFTTEGKEGQSLRNMQLGDLVGEVCRC